MQLICRFVGTQCLREVRPLVEIVDIQRLDLLDACLAQFLQQLFGNLIIGIADDFTCLGIDDVVGENPANEKLVFDHYFLEPGLLHLAHMLDGNALVLLDNELAAEISELRLAEVYSEFGNLSGAYKEHLPMQWGFTWLTENNDKVVYSTKIVVHENFRVFYHLKFANDGKFERISSIHFKSQLNNETVSESVYSVISSN